MRPLPLTILLIALPFAQALALESATTGSQATQATVGVINSKVDTGLAALQNRLDKMSACEAQRKFYAPSDPKKDANGCVGVGDYDLNMASGSNVNLANGYMRGNNSTGEGLVVAGGLNTWAGDFVTNGYGILSYLNNGAYSGKWSAEFYGGYGVNIGNTSNNAQLCLNGYCTSAIPGIGSYTYPNNGPSAYAGWYGYSFVCPGNTVMVGLAVYTAGNCQTKCNGDGPIIRNIQLICR